MNFPDMDGTLPYQIAGALLLTAWIIWLWIKDRPKTERERQFRQLLKSPLFESRQDRAARYQSGELWFLKDVQARVLEVFRTGKTLASLEDQPIFWPDNYESIVKRASIQQAQRLNLSCAGGSTVLYGNPFADTAFYCSVLDQANGEILARLEAEDDRWRPAFVQAMHEELKRKSAGISNITHTKNEV